MLGEAAGALDIALLRVCGPDEGGTAMSILSGLTQLVVVASLIAGAGSGAAPIARAEGQPEEAWLADRLAWFQDLKFGFMMHWGAYSQWGCIESWPLVEEDRWARPDDLISWTVRGKNIDLFRRDYWRCPAHSIPPSSTPHAGHAWPRQPV